MHHKYGHFAFVGGILLSIIAALLQITHSFISFALLIIGVIIGLLNIHTKEVTPFLVACTALVVAGSADFQVLNIVFDPVGTVMTQMFAFVKLFVTPAALVVGIKAVIVLARS